MRHIFIVMVLLANTSVSAYAAVGCSLDDPDRDVKRLFPESTGYRTIFATLKEIGGQGLKSQVEEKLGDKFDAVYESPDVPYAYYTVLQGKEPVGHIHGVNQKGKFGVLQLVLATDLEGKAIAFYYQKISSPEAGVFRSSIFTDQFKGLTLADFMAYDVLKKTAVQGGVLNIKDPSKNSAQDFFATLRGLKKNMILLDEFLHGQANKGGR